MPTSTRVPRATTRQSRLLATARANARYYDPPPGARPGDRLLNASAVAAEFGVTVSAIRQRKPGGAGRFQVDGVWRLTLGRACRELGEGGRPIGPKTLHKLARAAGLKHAPATDPDSLRAVKTWAEEEVEALKAFRAAPPPQRRKGPDGWYIPRDETMSRLGVADATMTRLARRLRQLSGPGPKGGHDIWYHEGDVARSRTARRWAAAHPGRYRVGGELYCTGRYAGKRLGLRRDTLGALEGEGKVTVEMADADGRRGPAGERKVYRVADLRAYLRRRAEGFDGAYPDGRVNLPRAAHDFGAKRQTLTKYIRRGWLPALLQEPPRLPGRNKPEHTVYPGDVRRLLENLEEAARSGRPEGNWSDARGLGELCGARPLGARIMLGWVLREGRQGGAVRAFRPQLPIEVRGGARRRPWLYDTEEALAFVAGYGFAVVRPTAAELMEVAGEVEAMPAAESRREGGATGPRILLDMARQDDVPAWLAEQGRAANVNLRQLVGLAQEHLAETKRQGEQNERLGRLLQALVDGLAGPAATGPHAAGAGNEKANGKPPTARAVDDAEERILRALHKRAPLMLNYDKVEANGGGSRHTISARLPGLVRDGLAAQPKGPKGGTTITEAGERLLQQLGAGR